MTRRKPLPDLRRIERLRKLFADDLYALIEEQCTVNGIASSAGLDSSIILALATGEKTNKDVTVSELHLIAEAFFLQIIFRIDDDDQEVFCEMTMPVEEIFRMGARPIFTSEG